MRVSLSTRPLPSNTALAAITMRLFGAGVCAEICFAEAQTPRMIRLQRMGFVGRMIAPSFLFYLLRVKFKLRSRLGSRHSRDSGNPEGMMWLTPSRFVIGSIGLLPSELVCRGCEVTGNQRGFQISEPVLR